ncbi:AAA family ATPase [Cyclobacterium jeungdonense]|uniref:AAA family ATPase n=1 Tax=Cyclobacterium jeungdonense TaxID=708087 RepID=A0ABT8C8H4_9BACT|nr:AAA family ATPase [Cyclobacterium jeungdonense]MDN3688113.1 AAA family ATPase [Cyclobacterium jeungdonense]
MAELINSFNYYNEFERYSYFSVCFDRLPSSVGFETPLKMDRAHMEMVLETIDLAAQEMGVVFKHWNTEDTKVADFSEDFPYQYLLKSKTKKLLIWLSLEFDQLYVDTLYDALDLDLEQWVILTNHKLRMKFGLDRTPGFKVLSRNDNGFFTQEVKTDNFECDIQKLYNDDFAEINELIEASLDIDKAGLILLHGVPGAGKTSYIKNLISRHQEKSFIFIQNEFINELLHPNFISFLLKNQNAVLIIEDAEKVLTSREQVNETSVVSTILQLTDGLFSDYLNFKIICTFNTSIDKIDKALLRKGRMIAYYEFQPLIPEKANKLLRQMNYESTSNAMTLSDIFNYEKRNFQQAKKGTIGFQK